MIAGVDEAGRGPILGPLVITGVMVHDEEALRSFDVRDSKQLSPQRRQVLAKKIKEHCLAFETVIINASDIDDMRKVMTLNEIELNGYIKIISKLKPTICYVDSVDVNAHRFGKEIAARIPKRCEIISEHKADERYPVVSAASILAKTIRDDQIHRIEQMLQKKLNKPLGSGYPADPVTQNFLVTWVNQFGTLPPHTRHSWKTAKNILNRCKTKTLKDF